MEARHSACHCQHRYFLGWGLEISWSLFPGRVRPRAKLQRFSVVRFDVARKTPNFLFSHKGHAWLFLQDENKLQQKKQTFYGAISDGVVLLLLTQIKYLNHDKTAALQRKAGILSIYYVYLCRKDNVSGGIGMGSPQTFSTYIIEYSLQRVQLQLALSRRQIHIVIDWRTTRHSPTNGNPQTRSAAVGTN